MNVFIASTNWIRASVTLVGANATPSCAEFLRARRKYSREVPHGAYTTAAAAIAPAAPSTTTNQGVRQETSRRKTRTPSPKSTRAKVALVQTGVCKRLDSEQRLPPAKSKEEREKLSLGWPRVRSEGCSFLVIGADARGAGAGGVSLPGLDRAGRRANSTRDRKIRPEPASGAPQIRRGPAAHRAVPRRSGIRSHSDRQGSSIHSRRGSWQGIC